MKMIEDAVMVDGNKCIQFVPRTDEEHYAHIEDDGGWEIKLEIRGVTLLNRNHYSCLNSQWKN